MEGNGYVPCRKPARIWAMRDRRSAARLTPPKSGLTVWVGEQPSACDRGDRVELESLVLEIMGQLVELTRDLRGPGLRRPSPALDERGVVRPALHPRLSGGVLPHRGDRVSVAVVGESVYEIPMPPDRADAKRSHRDAPDEERYHERRVQRARCK